MVFVLGFLACERGDEGNRTASTDPGNPTPPSAGVGAKGPDATKNYPPLTHKSDVKGLVLRAGDVPRYTGNDVIDNKYTEATLFISNAMSEELANQRSVEIEKMLTEVVRDAPEHAMAYVNLVRIRWFRAQRGSNGNLSSAVLQPLEAPLARAEAIDNKLSEVHVQRGYVELERRDLKAAESRSARARALDAGSPRPALLEGTIASTKKDYASMVRLAAEALGKARTIRDQGQALDLSRRAYQGLGAIDRADQAHRDLLTLFPRSCWMRGNYSLFLSRNKRFGEGIRAAQDALKLCDYRGGRNALSLAYSRFADFEYSDGNFKTARQLWEFALEHDPDNPRAHQALGVWWANQFMDDKNGESRKRALHHLSLRENIKTNREADAKERAQARSLAQRISKQRAK